MIGNYAEGGYKDADIESEFFKVFENPLAEKAAR